MQRSKVFFSVSLAFAITAPALFTPGCVGEDSPVPAKPDGSTVILPNDGGSGTETSVATDTGVACSKQVCGASCVDLQSDKEHCGACGHSCLGGACNAGVCAPQSVHVGSSNVSTIKSDGTDVYWGERGTSTAASVMIRMNKSSAIAKTFFAVPPAANDVRNLVQIELSATSIAYGYQGSVPSFKVTNKAAPADSQRMSYRSGAIVFSPDGSRAYTASNVGMASPGIHIFRLSDHAEEATLVTAYRPSTFFVDGTKITFGSGDGVSGVKAGIYNVDSVAGFDPSQITLTPLGAPTQLTREKGRLFWVIEGVNLQFYNNDNQPGAGFPGSTEPAQLVATNNGVVYWVEGADAQPGALYACPAAGCPNGTRPPALVPADGHAFTALHVDDDGIYFAKDDQSVYRMARPL